jgi:hypothetical protein
VVLSYEVLAKAFHLKAHLMTTQRDLMTVVLLDFAVNGSNM